MKSMYSKDEVFLAAAKKKPRLKALLDDLPNMSFDDIKALKERPWIIKSLLILKETNGIGAKKRLDLKIQQAYEKGRLAQLAPKEKYEVRMWHGDSIFAKMFDDVDYVGNILVNYEKSFEINDNDIFIIMNDSIKIGHHYSKANQTQIDLLKKNSKLIGMMDLQTYLAFYRNYISQKGLTC